MEFQLEAAPMQGFIDHAYRTAYLSLFQGIDRLYTPFAVIEKGGLSKKDEKRLALAARETPRPVVQIAASCAEDVSALCRFVIERGFQAVNLNLGCPYPMETRRKRGAGALSDPALVESLLGALTATSNALAVSVKMRLGLTDPCEFKALIPILNRFDLEKIILHPRTATDMYDGKPRWDKFFEYGRLLNAPVIANGDLRTVNDIRRVQTDYPFVRGVMLGRGLLADPFLPARVKGLPLCADPTQPLRALHDKVYAVHSQRLSPVHVLDKMRSFWYYTNEAFAGGEKRFKKIKKAKTVEAYLRAVDMMFAATENSTSKSL